MQVVHFQRRPLAHFFSLERAFATVRNHFPAEVECRVAISRFPSSGFFKRIYNIVEAWTRQGEVNHVTGDVHFLDLFMRKRRTLLTVLDCVMLTRLRGWRWWVMWFFWYWLPVRRAALISVISAATRDDLLRQVRCDPAKVRVVPVPVAEGLGARPKAFATESPLILQVGTTENKNLERVAAALESLPCRLRIVGPLSEAQQAALRRHGIDFSSATGLNDEELAAEYEHCDLVIFASTFEGFGLPIIEAQTVGRPVVTSNFGPMDDVAGDGACLVDPFAPSSIRTGVQKVIADESYRRELVRRGYENAQRFQPAAVAAQYVELYKELLAKA